MIDGLVLAASAAHFDWRHYMYLGKYVSSFVVFVAIAGTSFAIPQTDQSAKQDMKDAGHEAKTAAKETGRATKKTATKTGHAVKKTTKKAANKTAQKTKEGAEKVEDKTQPN
jgi:Ni/Co efflux regulator RcnB